MSDGDTHKLAADQVSEAVFALEDVDLNTLTDDEVRTLLDAKDDISDICLRLRQDQHASRCDQESD